MIQPVRETEEEYFQEVFLQVFLSLCELSLNLIVCILTKTVLFVNLSHIRRIQFRERLKGTRQKAVCPCKKHAVIHDRHSFLSKDVYFFIHYPLCDHASCTLYDQAVFFRMLRHLAGVFKYRFAVCKLVKKTRNLYSTKIIRLTVVGTRFHNKHFSAFWKMSKPRETLYKISRVALLSGKQN